MFATASYLPGPAGWKPFVDGIWCWYRFFSIVPFVADVGRNKKKRPIPLDIFVCAVAMTRAKTGIGKSANWNNECNNVEPINTDDRGLEGVDLLNNKRNRDKISAAIVYHFRLNATDNKRTIHTGQAEIVSSDFT